ncbi:MAG: hypothetical protein DRJ38_06250 [Thermoprotei archaeon]|nr:MAG: hypothetical protein DRJ38_06250 [Thermoprotei archaeon]
MSRPFDYLKVKPGQRATSTWANTVVDILNDLYGGMREIETRGTAENPFYELYGYYGYFYYDLYVQGKRVIKDEDPINLYDIFEPAKQRITQAINESKVPSSSDIQNLQSVVAKESLQRDAKLVLEQLYGLVSYYEPRFDEKIEVIRNRVASMFIDEYGNVGVIISKPIDEYGRVLVSQRDLDAELLHVGGEIDTSTATPPVEVITPPPGRSIDIRRGFASTDSTRGRVYIKFKNSGKIITVIYASKYGFVEIPAVRIPGDPDDPVVVEWYDLDAGAYVFYSINYRIV